LRHVEGDRSQPGIDGFWLETICVSPPAIGSLVWGGLDYTGAFDSHGLIEYDSHGFRNMGQAGFTEELNNAIYCATFGLVGHFGFLSFEFVVQRSEKQIWPTTTRLGLGACVLARFPRLLSGPQP
jgi:hypothetical protein